MVLICRVFSTVKEIDLYFLLPLVIIFFQILLSGKSLLCTSPVSYIMDVRNILVVALLKSAGS
jgi:hypothetical protein